MLKVKKQMNEILFKAFRGYCNRVSSISRSSPDSIRKHVSLYISASTKIEECENTFEFTELVEESLKESSFVLHGFLKSRGIWEHAIKNFFRRSGYYNSIIENNPISVDDIFKKYLSAFQRSSVHRTYLVPMGLEET